MNDLLTLPPSLRQGHSRCTSLNLRIAFALYSFIGVVLYYDLIIFAFNVLTVLSMLIWIGTLAYHFGVHEFAFQHYGGLDASGYHGKLGVEDKVREQGKAKSEDLVVFEMDG